MANIKITDLASLTNPATTDVVPVVDVDADVTKKVSVGEIVGKIGGDVNVATNGASTIAAGVIVNADVNASAAIAGTKIDPDFGSQTVETTGDLAINTNVLFVDSSEGKVGLGTSSPDTLFHLSKSGTSAIARIASSSVGATAFDGSGAGLELTCANANTTSKYAPAIKFGSTDNEFTTTNPKFGAAITAEATQAYSADTNGGMALGFWTSPNDPGTGNGLEQRLTIDSLGNVGIGTTSPNELLHISAGTNSTIRLGGSGGNFAYSIRANVLSNVSNFGLLIEDAQNGNDLYRVVSGSSGYHYWAIDDSEKVRIDSFGRLLVGTSSSRTNFGNSSLSAQLQVEGNSTSGSSLSLTANGSANTGNPIPRLYLNRSRGALGTNVLVNQNDSLGEVAFQGNDGSEFVVAGSIDCKIDGTPGANDMPGRIILSTTASGASSPTERMFIYSTGRVRCNNSFTSSSSEGEVGALGTGINGATLYNSGALYIQRDANPCFRVTRLNSDGSIMDFRRDTSLVGSISVTTTATAYNTSSDYRLKENVVPLTGAVDRLNQLQVHRFNFIADPDTTVDGFLAHEAQAIVPESVTGTKDEVDDEGNPVYQGIDQSKIVPLVVAALQEALAEIETLKTRLADAGIG